MCGESVILITDTHTIGVLLSVESDAKRNIPTIRDSRFFFLKAVNISRGFN